VFVVMISSVVISGTNASEGGMTQFQVPASEVNRACQELGIRDWSKLDEITVSLDEAKAIRAALGAEAGQLSIEDFRQGLQVELEHGEQYSAANVTSNHPVLTGKIVLAHLKESLLYYKRIAVAELEGDLLKVIQASGDDGLRKLYARLLEAKVALLRAEQEMLAK
jgi:hypothetical protein